jgi:predicted ABC-class ATPase
MKSERDLRELCRRIDGRGYKAYKDLRGVYHFPRFTLLIDYVQGDPFAAPSRLRLQVPQTVARYPTHTFDHPSRRVGLENYLALAVDDALQAASGRRGSGKSGLLRIDRPGQEMLERTAVHVTPDHVTVQLAAGLPAQGRRVLGRQAAAMLCDDLPRVVDAALQYDQNDQKLLRQFTETAEDADFLRAALVERELVTFIVDGAILPRRSGVDPRPLRNGAIPWQSPPELAITIDLPHAGAVRGTGIPRGVTLIVGGGFHGKSTLLNAIEHGVYNHRPGDGRERVVTVPTAAKIRAEDGRGVAGVDISPFINNLPGGRGTTQFSSPNASGSTSQAANIVEALELGAELLLIDEDTAATNFMIRDRRMQQLIAREKEPITPFIDRVQTLYRQFGISTVLVIGGSGDYFDVADRVIGMEAYRATDLTAAAKAIAAAHANPRAQEGDGAWGAAKPRIPEPRSIDLRKGRREVSVKTHGLETIQLGTERVDLSGVAQLVDESQTRAIAAALAYARGRYVDGRRSLAEIVELVMADVERAGLGVLDGRPGNDFAQFRSHELGAALNRLRTLRCRPK